VETVIKDKGQILGLGSIERARDLSMMLRAGALPVPLEVLHAEVLEPTLGQESIDKSKLAAGIGAGLVVLFMLIVYRFPGFIADIALVIYSLIVMASLAGLKAVLTLPGIAGLILSLGMAVDSNIIIFERIKEELKSGKRVRAAIESGFSRAFGCILDSNVTTLITAGALYFFGSGAVRGFAVTLGLGIVASMFTAIVVTKLILVAVVDRNPEKWGKHFGV
jgi:preprotein translocase subunit SecD